MSTETQFTCLFCHHDKSVSVRINRKEGVAQLLCKVCDQRYQSKANRTCLSPSAWDSFLTACVQTSLSPSTSTRSGLMLQMPQRRRQPQLGDQSHPQVDLVRLLLAVTTSSTSVLVLALWYRIRLVLVASQIDWYRSPHLYHHVPLYSIRSQC